MANAFRYPARTGMPDCFRRHWVMGWASPFIVGRRINSHNTVPKPVIITVRDATYVLDAILDNETRVADSGTCDGYCRGNRNHFALFDLLGYRFTPRLQILAAGASTSGPIDMQVYAQRLQPYVSGRINRQRILDWWDEMLRLTGSLKLGYVTASLMVQKLNPMRSKMR